MHSHYDFVELVYEYPVGLPPPSNEDYFFLPVLVAKEMGMKTAIFAGAVTSNGTKTETIKGVDVFRIQSPAMTLARLSRAKPSLVHGHSFGFISATLAPIVAHRYVLTPHIYKLDAYTKWKLSLVLEFAKRSDAIITLTEFEASQFKRILPSNKVHVIPNSIDYAYFCQKSTRNIDEFLSKYGLARDNEIILTVANLQPRKNLETLIKAFSLIKNKFPLSKLVIVGEQPKSVLSIIGSSKPKWNYLTVLTKLVASLGIKDSVHFVGYQRDENLRSFYTAARVFCLPSRMEGQLLAAGEAASSGLPLVLSNLEPLKEIYEGCAVFHDPLDYRELSHHVMCLFSNSELAMSLGNVGREKMQSYTPTKIKARLRNIYEQLLFT